MHVASSGGVFFDLWLCALPDQVVQQGEGWFCEYDGRTYPDMVRRYVMQAKCIDASGEATLSVFDEQARALPSCPASVLPPASVHVPNTERLRGEGRWWPSAWHAGACPY